MEAAVKDKNMMELETEPVSRLLIKYSLPAIAGMVVYSLYNVVDSIFIGRWVGADALSGLAIAFPIMTLTFALGTLIGIGGASVCSIRLGENNLDAAHRVLGNVFVMSIILGIAFGWSANVFLDEILTAFGASAATLPPAHDFMQITLAALPLTFLFFNLNHVMRASGYPRKAMLTTMFSVCVNIVLAPIFINLFGWGMRGAALATMFAQIVGVSWVFAHFFRASSTLHFMRGIFALSAGTIKSIVSIGLSPCIMNALSCAVVVVINHALLRNGGDMAVGAHGILSRILILIAMVVIGITQGMQPVIGYNHGAGKTSRVRETLRYGISAGAIVTTLGAAACVISPSLISHMFTKDGALLAISDEALRYGCLGLPLVGPQVVIGNFFQALGRAKISIFISTTRQALFLIPLLLTLPHFFGRVGVWFSLPIADVSAFVLSVFMLVRFLKTYSAVPADLAGEKARKSL